jgi:tetratricopeptide (TPR) repeat protein
MLSSCVLAALVLAGSPSEQIQAQRWLKEGQDLLDRERPAEAAVAFREAIRLDRLLVMAHYGLGQSEMALKEYPAAVRAFLAARESFDERLSSHQVRRFERDQASDDRVRALQDNINETTVRATGGSVRATRNREARIAQWEMEIAQLQRAQRDDAHQKSEFPPGMTLALGSAYFRSGLLADAEREYLAVLKARPKQGEAHNNLAVVLLLTARPLEAREHAEAARKCGFEVAPGLVRDIEAALATASATP